MSCKYLKVRLTRRLFPGDAPLRKGVTLKRINGERWTNVPYFAIYHSPTGFEWGYGGSGPADLALNILEYYLHSERLICRDQKAEVYKGRVSRTALALHQDFKWHFIATMPPEGGFIPREEIVKWIRVRLEVRRRKNEEVSR